MKIIDSYALLKESIIYICRAAQRLVAQSGASPNQVVAGSSPGQATFFRWDFVMKKKMSTTILTLPLLSVRQCTAW